MKKIGGAFVITILIFLFTIFVVTPIMSNLGYSSAEASYHLVTHALLVSLIFTVIVCTMILIEKMNEMKEK